MFQRFIHRNSLSEDGGNLRRAEIASLSLAMTVIPLFSAAHFGSALMGIIHLTLVMVFAVVVARSETRHKQFVLGCWLVSMGMIVLFALWQTITQWVPAHAWFGLAEQAPERLGAAVVWIGGERWLRPYGSFSHPNIFGGMAALASVVAVVWSARARSVFVQRLGSLLAGLCAFGVMASVSRAGVLALVLGLLAWAWRERHGARGQAHTLAPAGATPTRMSVPPARLWARGRSAWLCAWVGVAMGAWVFSAPWLARALPSDAVGWALEERSVTERGEQVSQWWQWTVAHPVHALFGVGIGQSTLATASVYADPKPAWAYQPVHVAPVVFLWEMGWLFTGVLLWFCWRVRDAIKRRFAEPTARALFIALLPLALLDHYLWTQVSSWFVLAMVLLLSEP